MSGLEWATNYIRFVARVDAVRTWLGLGFLAVKLEQIWKLISAFLSKRTTTIFHLNKETKVISLASPPTQHNSFFQTVNPLNLNVVDLLHNHEPLAFLSAFLALVPFVAFSSLIVNIHEPKECLRGRGTRRKRALAPRLSHTPGVCHVRPAPGVSLHWRAPEIA